MRLAVPTLILLAACGGQAQGSSPDGGRVDGSSSRGDGGGEADAGLDAGQDAGTDGADACGVPLCTSFDHTAACIGCLVSNCSLCSYESVCCPVTDDSCSNNTQIFDTCLAKQCAAPCASDGG
ncbi:MAG TPA: hypothetical protein VMI75_27460 [Polyangiaceae bacterium]|nr:hypothetical protein [Polyangiaceae bacterium]